ncbi:MAG: HU family DNA-binding protein [Alistipes sp.]|nr:HU family DNA-binding protein [Alistipes sp.]
MNKTQLVEVMAIETGISKITLHKAVDALVSVIVDTLRENERVTISGLGTFSVVKHPARVGRNPRTGAAIKIPPRKGVKFRPSLKLDHEEDFFE